MKISMELRPKDVKLLKGLACVLIIFFLGYFVIFPGIEKHQDLVVNKEGAQQTKQEMQDTIDNAPIYEKMVEKQKGELKEASEGYYSPMANREVDELVTGLVLQHNLFPVYLNITDPVSGIPAAYQSVSKSGAETEDSASTDTSETDTTAGEDASADSSDSTSADAEQSAVYQKYVGTITVNVTLQGSEENIRELLDDIANNYPGIQVRSFDMQENTYVDSNLQTVGEMNCSCVLAVYTCEDLTNVNTEGETTN